MNVLILGGTRYVGLRVIERLIKKKLNLWVASRKKIEYSNFVFVDRKSSESLNQVLTKNKFDIIIDFICFSSFDAKILCELLSKLNYVPPNLLVISTTYVYSLPYELSNDMIFRESSFDPKKAIYSLKDRPEVDYAQGKREMESYLYNNYNNEKLTILRFPVVLGSDDYTGRTNYYFELIKENNKKNISNINNKTNYILSDSAAQSIVEFSLNQITGIYNIAYPEISELNIIRLYAEVMNIKFENIIDNRDLSIENSPFSNNYNFIIDTNEFKNYIEFKESFSEKFLKELYIIKKKNKY